MKFKVGNKVRDRKSSKVGVVKRVKERGVAGSAVTYAEWIEVICKDGIINRVDPSRLELVSDD